METTTLPPVGAKVKLTRDRPRWWDVRCADERFAILTRQAEFKPKGQVYYTILDVKEGVRGPCDLIGQSWHETMPDEACQELLAELQIGAKINAWNAGERDEDIDLDKVLDGRGSWVGISHRNRVPLGIVEVRSTTRG